MHILLLHQHFRKPAEGGGIRSYHVAKALVAKGHTVTIITAHDQAFYREEFEGLHIFHLHVPYENHFSFFRRLKAFYGFYRKALALAKNWQHIDVIYAISTPLSVGLLGRKLKSILKARFIFEVGDLWPAVPVSLGIIKNRWLISWLFRQEEKIYASADHIIALSPGIQQYISQKAHTQKISIIPNMADVALFSAAYGSKANTNTPFTIGYFGTFGFANHVEGMINLATACQQRQLPVSFLMMGDGAYKKRAEALVKQHSLANVQFFAHGPTQAVADRMKLCDAVMVSFLDNALLHTGSPNKFFDGLAAGKLILHNLSGWIALLVNEHEIGFQYHPDNATQFVDMLIPYLEHPEKLAKAQHNAYQLAEKDFKKELLCDKIIEVVEAS